ncbi:hypothetical protein ACFC96_10915 [Streptomyces sp. NPDC055955]
MSQESRPAGEKTPAGLGELPAQFFSAASYPTAGSLAVRPPIRRIDA